MTTVASPIVRKHTAEVLRQVSDGTRVTITVNGKPVIGPVRTTRPQFFTKAEFVELASHHQADAGMSRVLELLAGDTTDELDTL